MKFCFHSKITLEEIKLHTPKVSWSQKENLEISWHKLKWKYNISKLWDTAKAIVRGSFILINS
jgi:hypothetical protein